jgi:predicted nucleic acid-binding protein
MDRIVSNATPLIYLAKIDKLNLIKAIANQVYIPEAVFQEVVIEGKRLGEKDAYLVEKCINQGWLKVKEVKNLLSFDFQLHYGELEVISLAGQEGIKKVLIDDAKARSVADIAGLQPVGTLWVILQAVKSRMMDFDEFLSTLESIIHSGFYLKDEVYIKVIRKARQLSEEQL